MELGKVGFNYILILILSVKEGAAQSSYCYDDTLTCGPSHWVGLCANGTWQSPINIIPERTSASQPKRTLLFSSQFYEDSTLNFIDNGDFVAIRQPSQDPAASQIRVRGSGLIGTYGFFAGRFHWGSEHLIKGRRFAMECQLVFQSQKLTENYAVISILFSIKKASNVIAPVVSLIPKLTKGSLVAFPGGFNLSKLLPPKISAFRYTGSLSTPPCNETALYTIFAQRMPISQDQVNAFMTLRDINNNLLTKSYRPIQAAYTTTRKSIFGMELSKEKMIEGTF